MKQMAVGGVNKVVFAGYATDPLNYEHIEDLVQVAVDARYIIGFHTKVLRTSDRLRGLLTSDTNAPMSYFSIVVDSGSNEIYNAVHGVPESKAKMYDKVR